jgi:hypothetical protein
MDMQPQKIDSTIEMPTLAQCVNKALKDGYTDSYKIVAKGMTADTEDHFYGPTEVKIANFYRFEGYSDPMDNCILYLVETSDGRKGQLIDAYGAYADSKVSGFIREVEDIQKKKK